MRESVKVLHECIDIQDKKSNDYQNPNSMVRQADYYPSGCLTILDSMHGKILRMRSVIEAMTNDPGYSPNFESLEDSAKDLINYASFFVAYSRGKIDGQDPSRDFLNRKIKSDITLEVNPSVLTFSVGDYPTNEDYYGQLDIDDDYPITLTTSR